MYGRAQLMAQIRPFKPTGDCGLVRAWKHLAKSPWGKLRGTGPTYTPWGGGERSGKVAQGARGVIYVWARPTHGGGGGAAGLNGDGETYVTSSKTLHIARVPAPSRRRQEANGRRRPEADTARPR